MGARICGRIHHRRPTAVGRGRAAAAHAAHPVGAVIGVDPEGRFETKLHVRHRLSISAYMLDPVAIFRLDTGHTVQAKFAHRVLKIETGGALSSPAFLFWGTP